MGYYSDVSLLLNAEAKEKLDESLQSVTNDVKQLFNEACDYSAIDPDSGTCFYHWCYSKWGWDETVVVTKFLNSLDEDTYSYLRLGETYGDLEERGLLDENHFDPRVDSKIIYNKVDNNNKRHGSDNGEIK